MDIQPFSPTANSVTVAASVASASGALPGATGNQIRIHNASTGVAFVRWTTGASTAVLTDSFISVGGTEIFSIPPFGIDTFSVILASGTGNVYAQRGYGV